MTVTYDIIKVKSPLVQGDTPPGIFVSRSDISGGPYAGPFPDEEAAQLFIDIERGVHGSEDGLPDPVHNTPLRHLYADELEVLGIPESEVRVGVDEDEVLTVTVRADLFSALIQDTVRQRGNRDLVQAAVDVLVEAAGLSDEEAEAVDEHFSDPLYDFDAIFHTELHELFVDPTPNYLLNLARTIAGLAGLEEDEDEDA